MKVEFIPKRSIVAYRESDRHWYITIDGRQHPSDFVSTADIRAWVGTMQVGGLYTGRDLWVPNEKTGQYERVEPVYE